MINFLGMTVKNFMSWRGTTKVPLNRQGIVRVEGRNLDESAADSNMAGKSVILEALVWCLFGRTVRGLKHDSIVNRFGKRNCFVDLRFNISGLHYRVRRYRRHKTHGNRLRFWRGEALVSHRHESETQSRLETILGCDFTGFSNSVIFGGVRAFASMSDAEQKKVLESFLHFEQFDNALKRTKDELSNCAEKLSDLRVEVEKERGEAKRLRERLITLKESQEVFVRKARKEYDKLKRKLDELEEPERVSLDEVKSAEVKLEKRVSKLAAAKEREKQIRSRLARVKKTYRDRREMLGKPCPACGQNVTPRSLTSFKKHLKRDRRSLRAKLSHVLDLVTSLERRVAYGRKDLKRLKEKQTSAILYDTSKTELERRMGLGVPPSSSSLKLKAEKTSLQYSRAMSRMLVSERNIAMLEGHIKDLEFWKQGFGNQGIKSVIVKDALPSLNTKLKQYADQIFGGSAELKFVPTKEKKSGGERELFHVQYVSRRGGSSYLAESAGGRRRVDICILLVFAWLSRISNLLLIDELLDGLDESGRESVLNILGTLRGTVLTITHKKDLKSRIGKVWLVTKKNGVSRLETAA